MRIAAVAAVAAAAEGPGEFVPDATTAPLTLTATAPPSAP
jgi:hypothetical protein